MLFGILPLLLVGLGLTFLLDAGADDDPEPESGELDLTPGNDMLDMADTGATTVNALGGNDTITSDETGPILLRLGAGDDVAELSNGFAEVYGGTGDDEVVMSDGALLAFLGFGNDTVEGIDGEIEAYGQGGNDLMSATQFDDTLDGGSGNDTLDGGEGDDRLLGDLGDDLIEGGRGDDVVLGGAGNDTISDFNSMEEDLLIGGAGDDLIESDGRGDTVYGYSGNDTLNGYALSSLQNDDPGAVLDGGVGNDDLMGDLNSTMTGGAGQDDFTVVSEFGTVDTPAVITDFNPAENDRIFLTITPEAFGDPRDGPDYEVTRQVAADGSGVEILVNGDVYVKLEGITTLEGWIVNIRENSI